MISLPPFLSVRVQNTVQPTSGLGLGMCCSGAALGTDPPKLEDTACQTTRLTAARGVLLGLSAHAGFRCWLWHRDDSDAPYRFDKRRFLGINAWASKEASPCRNPQTCCWIWLQCISIGIRMHLPS